VGKFGKTQERLRQLSKSSSSHLGLGGTQGFNSAKKGHKKRHSPTEVSLDLTILAPVKETSPSRDLLLNECSCYHTCNSMESKKVLHFLNRNWKKFLSNRNNLAWEGWISGPQSSQIEQKGLKNPLNTYLIIHLFDISTLKYIWVLSNKIYPY